jgi:putative membrane protein
MRLLLTTAVASLAIATAACSNERADNTDVNISNDAMMNDGMNSDMNADMNMAGNGSTEAALAPADFVATVAGSDMYEIQSGKLAQSKGSSDAVKQMGAKLVTDHTKSSSDLKAAAAAASPAVTVPTALPAELETKLTALKAATGAEFDRLFVEQQKAGHQKTLGVLQGFASGGTAPSLKDFATKTAPVVQAHLDQMNAMKM